MSWSIGVDIGGTFTDCVGVDGTGRVVQAKALSTHGTDPSQGVIDALGRLADAVGTDPRALLQDTARVAHGTTIGTNLLVERRGARTALVTTAGHGDALSMMRGTGRTAGLPIDQVFDVQATRKPEPFVARRHIVELHERVAADGAVVAPLDEADARTRLRALFDGGEIDGVAVCLLWSVRNPVHEQRVAELVRELAPEAFISLSHQTAPRQGEYERAVASVINSYVGPASVAYLDALAVRLRDGGFGGEMLVMQSGGGVVAIDQARARPMALIGSGPAGGIAGVAALASAAGHENVIATDMGGTSFEVGLLVGGRPVLAGQQVIEQHAFHHPHLDARSIACGGGSIAAVASDGGLRVGPHSAGSDPGPAAYGGGGSEPTVTDADVVLGLLDPSAFLGGTMQLDESAARRAVGAVAEQLGLSVEEAAAGILQINNHAAATLIRQRTLEQGLDPRDFAVYAYGGAGPVHAFGIAAELGAQEVVIPLGNGASTLSAYGIAVGDLVQHHEVECRVRAPLDALPLADVVAEAEAAARDAQPDPTARLRRVALMRYAEQYLQALPVELPDGPVDAAACATLLEHFDAEYGRQFGEFAKALFQAVEIFAVQVESRVPSGVAPVRVDAPQQPAAARTQRAVHWPGAGALDTDVWDGLQLAAGQRLTGPAVVELPHTTVAVAPGQTLTRDAGDDSLRLHLPSLEGAAS